MGHAGLVGAAAAEAATGVSWADAGKVELEQPQYLGFPLPGLSVSALTTIEVLLMGYLEVARSAELDQDKRMYPGARSIRSGTPPTPTRRRFSDSKRRSSSTVVWPWSVW